MSDADLVDRLLDDAIACQVIISDVDDVIFYGEKHKRRTTGKAAARLVRCGFELEVYQAVRWRCLVFLPLVPLGTCAVADSAKIAPGGDDHTRCFRVRTDWSQAVSHALVGISVMLGIGLAVWFALANRGSL